MAKRPEGYWKRYYQEHREQRIAESIEYQSRNAQKRREYMRRWSEQNRDHVREYRRATAGRRNERNRQRYKTDAAYREKIKADVKSGRKRHPKTRWARNLRNVGLTLEDYDTMLAGQGGGCAICGNHESGDKRTPRFHVDHCHATGVVRGLLCSSCNLGLGKFADSPERLERAALYLRLQIGKAGSD